MTVPDHPSLWNAMAIVDREIEYATDERAAFDRFQARLADVDPATPSAMSTAGSGIATTRVATRSDRAPAASLRAVRTAYRATVMDVPHYEAEYDDTLRESLASEFGPEIAAQVLDGRQLTPPLYRALREGSETAGEDRERFRCALERERESLSELERALSDCERRLAGIESELDRVTTERLSRLDDRLADLESTCAELAGDRQELIHGRPDVHLSGVTGTSLVMFLYSGFDARCPALAAITDCLQRIREDRTRCLR